MVAIKLTAHIGEDRRLVIELPVKSTMESTQPLTRERAREVMQKAGVLSVYAIPDIEPLSDDELLALGTPSKDVPSSLDLINEDRN